PRVPCRIHLFDSIEQPIFPDELPHWNDHFVFNGTVTLLRDADTYTYEIERGPEYETVKGKLEVHAGEKREVPVVIHRIANMAKEGWWSGEIHVHRNAKDMELLMA